MPLQRPFTGLGKYIGYYQGGNIPIEWSGALVPTIAVDDWIQPPEWIQGVLTCTTVGDDALIAIEPGFHFQLLHCGWQTSSVVSFTTTKFNIGMSLTTALGRKVEILPAEPVQSGAAVNPAGTAQGNCYNYGQIGLHCEEGSTLRVYVRELAGAATSINYGFLVRKISV